MAYDFKLTVFKAGKALLMFGVPAAIVNYAAMDSYSWFLVIGTALSALGDYWKHRGD
jgi:hypothetical protein